MKQIASSCLMLPDGRVVVQRKTKDAPTNADKLTFFGGIMEDGETPEQTARRELQEETSLDVPALDFTFACKAFLPVGAKGNEPYTMHLFRVAVPSADFSVYEGEGAEVYGLTELKARADLSPAAAIILATLLGGKQ